MKIDKRELLEKLSQTNLWQNLSPEEVRLYLLLIICADGIRLIGDREPNPFSLSRLPQENRVLIINKDVIHFIVPLEETKDRELRMEPT